MKLWESTLFDSGDGRHRKFEPVTGRVRVESSEKGAQTSAAEVPSLAYEALLQVTGTTFGSDVRLTVLVTAAAAPGGKAVLVPKVFLHFVRLPQWDEPRRRVRFSSRIGD